MRTWLSRCLSPSNPKESASIWKLSVLTGEGGREGQRYPSLEACVWHRVAPWGIRCSRGWVGGLYPFPLTVCDQHMALLTVLAQKQKRNHGGHNEDNILPAFWGEGPTGPGWATPPFPGGSGVWLMVDKQQSPIRRVLPHEAGEEEAGDQEALVQTGTGC